MDEMTIKSKLLTGIISGIIEKEIKKRFGYEVDIQIGGFEFSNDEENVILAGEMGVVISHEELKKIINEHL